MGESQKVAHFQGAKNGSRKLADRGVLLMGDSKVLGKCRKLFRILIVVGKSEKIIKIVPKTAEIEQSEPKNGENLKISKSLDLPNHRNFPQTQMIFAIFGAQIALSRPFLGRFR